MSKIFGFYANDKDVNWYQSSNIRYSECDDHDNDLKTLRVVFNNGTQYEYKKISVQDYLMFRNDTSQGKALNQYIKGNGYEYEKLEDANMQALEDELNFRLEEGMFVFYDGSTFTLKDNKDNVVCEKEVKLTEAAFDTICSVLEALGKQIYTEGKNFTEENDNKEEKPF
jgi:hypothetical protein